MARPLSLFALLISVSQAGAIHWYHGVVVLRDNRVEVGQIARQSRDLILFNAGEGVTVYPAHQVLSFRYFDEAENINRKFLSFKVEVGAVQTFRFYESVVSGWIHVLREQKQFGERIDEKRGGDFHFYIYFDDRMFPMKKFRALYKKLPLSYPKDPALNPSCSADAIRLIRELNHSRPDRSINGS